MSLPIDALSRKYPYLSNLDIGLPDAPPENGNYILAAIPKAHEWDQSRYWLVSDGNNAVAVFEAKVTCLTPLQMELVPELARLLEPALLKKRDADLERAKATLRECMDVLDPMEIAKTIVCEREGFTGLHLSPETTIIGDLTDE